MKELDYKKLGLRVGLEIHQQLETHKLFCNCASKLSDTYEQEVIRALRPTQSELGDIDKAALEEARRKLKFKYQVPKNACLVELDEEPPHSPNREAIEIVLKVAKMLSAKLVDELNFMRKIVIDGSNTAGFQRTALVALNGKLDKVCIQTICIEEDAARKIGSEKGVRVYRLDRLGIPLIELATTADIHTPQQTKKIAERIGRLLRATGKAKRGIGTIRQDLNVSIAKGARVEIKGVQELGSLPLVVENEVRRQLNLLRVRDKLRKRRVKLVDYKPVDLTSIFRYTKCKVIREGLRKGNCVFGLRLPGFSGLVKVLGAEFAEHVKLRGITGILYSYELKSQGVSKKEVKYIKKGLKLDEHDDFLLVVEGAKKGKEALSIVCRRAEECVRGVPQEVRKTLPEATTAFLRPMPGEARMYPETDIEPISIGKKWRERLVVPELPERKLDRFVSGYKLSRQTSRQLIHAGHADFFETLARRYGMARTIAKTLLSTIPELEREGIERNNITHAILGEVFRGLSERKFAKEGIPQIISMMVKEGASIVEAIERRGLATATKGDIEKYIEELLKEKKKLVVEKGDRAFSPLMGLVMRRFRGKADGELVAGILREKIKRRR